MSRSLSFTDLRLANKARQIEWDADNQITAAYRGNELAGEVGEALEQAMSVILMGAAAGRICNVIKKLERERMGIRGARETLAHLAEELADGIICFDLAAMDFDVDLGEAVRAKFNATSEKNGLKTRLP
jgi:hypothetical protein